MNEWKRILTRLCFPVENMCPMMCGIVCKQWNRFPVAMIVPGSFFKLEYSSFTMSCLSSGSLLPLPTASPSAVTPHIYCFPWLQLSLAITRYSQREVSTLASRFSSKPKCPSTFWSSTLGVVGQGEGMGGRGLSLFSVKRTDTLHQVFVKD